MLGHHAMSLSRIINGAYMSIFSGRPEDVNSEANFLTEAIELRSSSIASTFADGISLLIFSFTSLAAAIFLTPIMT